MKRIEAGMTAKEELYLMVRRGREVPVGNLERTRKIEGKLGTVVSHKSRDRMLV